MVLAVKLSVSPTHTGELLPAVGAAGVALITTVVVAVGEVHPLTVTVTVYTPDAAVVTLGMDGSSREDVKLLGPVQL
jgi:hypothetical protein